MPKTRKFEYFRQKHTFDSFTIQASQIHAFILLVKLLHPILRIEFELEETSCWSFDWTNSDLTIENEVGEIVGTEALNRG